MKILSAALLSFLIVFSFFSEAEEPILTVEYGSNVQMSLVSQKIQEAIHSQTENLNFNVESFNIGTDPKVEIKGLEIGLSPLGVQLLETSGGVLIYSHNNKIKISINEISVNQYVTKKIGNFELTTLVSASCKGIETQFDDPLSQFQFEIKPIINGSMVTFQIGYPYFDLKLPSFHFSQLSCTGAQGFDELIKSTIAKTFENPIELNYLLQNQLLQKINSHLSQFAYQWSLPQLLTSNDKFSIYLVPQTMQLADHQMFSRGIIQIYSNDNNLKSLKTEKNYFKLNQPNEKILSDLVISQEAFEQIFSLYFSKETWSYDIDSNLIPEFQSLMKSRLKQIFVWTDLLNFSKNSIFKLHVSNQTQPKLTWISNDSFQLSNTFQINMKAPIKGQYVPYIYFEIPTQSQIKFQIEDNQLLLKSENTQLKIKYEWDKTYCERPGRCGSIGTSLVSKAILNQMSSTPIHLVLPQFKLLNGSELGLKSIQKNDKVINFRFH